MPPSDSIYYSHDILASLTADTYEAKEILTMGNFNAKIKNFNECLPMNSKFKYDFENQQQNGNGDIIKSICKQGDVLIVNGLKGKDFSYDHSLT